MSTKQHNLNAIQARCLSQSIYPALEDYQFDSSQYPQNCPSQRE